MNKDVMEGKWHEIKGKIKEKWANLTDDDLAKIEGKTENLLGSLQKRYGYSKDDAEKQVKEFEESCKSCASKKDGRHI